MQTGCNTGSENVVDIDLGADVRADLGADASVDADAGLDE